MTEVIRFRSAASILPVQQCCFVGLRFVRVAVALLAAEIHPAVTATPCGCFIVLVLWVVALQRGQGLDHGPIDSEVFFVRRPQRLIHPSADDRNG